MQKFRADRLQHLRRLHGFTQRRIAETLGVTTKTVSAWELTSAEPNGDNLIRLSQLLDTSVAYLIGETDQPLALPQQQHSELSDVQKKVLVAFDQGDLSTIVDLMRTHLRQHRKIAKKNGHDTA